MCGGLVRAGRPVGVAACCCRAGTRHHRPNPKCCWRAPGRRAPAAGRRCGRRWLAPALWRPPRPVHHPAERAQLHCWRRHRRPVAACRPAAACPAACAACGRPAKLDRRLVRRQVATGWQTQRWGGALQTGPAALHGGASQAAEAGRLGRAAHPHACAGATPWAVEARHGPQQHGVSSVPSLACLSRARCSSSSSRACVPSCASGSAPAWRPRVRRRIPPPSST